MSGFPPELSVRPWEPPSLQFSCNSLMSPNSKVFILTLAGQELNPLAFAQRRYPGCETVRLSQSELREIGWKHQLRHLRQMRGEVLLIFSDALESLRLVMLLIW